MNIKYRNVKCNVDFWYRNVEKCRINIKKIKPTPKSITHKNPMYTSISYNDKSNPIRHKYNPPVYNKTIRFVLVI